MKRVLTTVIVIIAAIVVPPVVVLSLLCGVVINLWLKFTALLGDGLLMSVSMALLILGPLWLVIALCLLVFLL